MSNDTLIRVGDGVTNEWVMSPANSGITNVSVDGVPVEFTQPSWNKVKLSITPAKGAEIQIDFQGLDGGDSAAAQVDLTPIASAIANLQMAIDNVQYGVYNVQYDVSNVGAALAASAGGGAVSGEVKLMALTAGQAVPSGWTLDTTREVVAADLPVIAVAPSYQSFTYGAGGCLAQVGDYTWTMTNGQTFYRFRQFTGTIDTTATAPSAYSTGNYPMVCSFNGKLAVLGGSKGGVFSNSVYEVGNDGVFTTLNNMPIPLSKAGVVELPGNRILVVGGYTYNGSYSSVNTLMVFTKGVGWQTLSQTLDEAVVYPHVAKLPSGKIGIFSGSVGGTATKSSKYYIFDPATLTLSAAKTIPTAHLPFNAYSGMTLRTMAGAAYITQNVNTDGNHYSEYNEGSDSFAAYQMKLPGGWLLSESSEVNAVMASDYQASPYGHMLVTSNSTVRPFVALKSGLIPSYRYVRKA